MARRGSAYTNADIIRLHFAIPFGQRLEDVPKLARILKDMDSGLGTGARVEENAVRVWVGGRFVRLPMPPGWRRTASPAALPSPAGQRPAKETPLVDVLKDLRSRPMAETGLARDRDPYARMDHKWIQVPRQLAE